MCVREKEGVCCEREGREKVKCVRLRGELIGRWKSKAN